MEVGTKSTRRLIYNRKKCKARGAELNQEFLQVGGPASYRSDSYI